MKGTRVPGPQRPFTGLPSRPFGCGCVAAPVPHRPGHGSGAEQPHTLRVVRLLWDSTETYRAMYYNAPEARHEAIAAHDRVAYAEAVERVLESFEARDAYLEDVPIADTVIVLQALAAARGLVAELPASALLP